MRTRAATEKDVARLAALDARGGTTWSEQTFTNLFAQPGVRIIVVEDQDIAGFAVLRQVLDEAEIFTIVVDPERRRQGLGGYLLGACHKQWTDSGVRSGHLEVRASNIAAIALYTHNGWRPTGRRASYYKDGEDAPTLSWAAPKTRRE